LSILVRYAVIHSDLLIFAQTGSVDMNAVKYVSILTYSELSTSFMNKVGNKENLLRHPMIWDLSLADTAKTRR
jgi:hypothetical protein